MTNYSVRETCISRLMDAEVPVNYVAQLSEHKNLKSLDSYKTASDGHQWKNSLLLSIRMRPYIYPKDTPLNPVVKASQQPLKHREDKQVSQK